MNVNEYATIENVIAALRNQTRTSDEIEAMLSDPNMRVWLDTWIVPALAMIIGEGGGRRDTLLARNLSRGTFKDGVKRGEPALRDPKFKVRVDRNTGLTK